MRKNATLYLLCLLWVFLLSCKSTSSKKTTIVTSKVVDLKVVKPKDSDINVDANIEIVPTTSGTFLFSLILHYFEAEKNYAVKESDSLQLTIDGKPLPLPCAVASKTQEKKAVLEGFLSDLIRADTYYAQALKYDLPEDLYLRLVKAREVHFAFSQVTGNFTREFHEEMRLTYNKTVVK